MHSKKPKTIYVNEIKMTINNRNHITTFIDPFNDITNSFYY